MQDEAKERPFRVEWLNRDLQGGPRSVGGAKADEVVAALADRARDLEARLDSLTAEMAGAGRRLVLYEEFDRTLHDALAEAYRAASRIRAEAQQSANELLAQAARERRSLLSEVERLRHERDELQSEIASLRRAALAEVARPAEETEGTTQRDFEIALAEEMRHIAADLAAELRAMRQASVAATPVIEDAPPPPVPAVDLVAPADVETPSPKMDETSTGAIEFIDELPLAPVEPEELPAVEAPAPSDDATRPEPVEFVDEMPPRPALTTEALFPPVDIPDQAADAVFGANLEIEASSQLIEEEDTLPEAALEEAVADAPTPVADSAPEAPAIVEATPPAQVEEIEEFPSGDTSAAIETIDPIDTRPVDEAAPPVEIAAEPELVAEEAASFEEEPSAPLVDSAPSDEAKTFAETTREITSDFLAQIRERTLEAPPAGPFAQPLPEPPPFIAPEAPPEPPIVTADETASFATPAHIEWTPEPTAAPTLPADRVEAEIQLVLSPVASFPQLIALQSRVRSLTSVRTLHLRDFRNGMATFAVGLGEHMSAEEFGAAVQLLEGLHLRLEGATRTSVELRVDEGSAPA